MIVVGLTGSLASGKSEAAKIFQSLGAKVFDADQSAKKNMLKGGIAYKAVLSLVGRGFLKKSGEFDRKKIAQHVFSNSQDLRKLNAIVHPLVIFDAINMIHRYKDKKGIIVLDVPLLFESKMDCLADTTILVKTQEEKMARRARGKFDSSLIKKILLAQWSVEKKARHADIVIENNGSLGDLKAKIVSLYNKITKTQQGGN